jgi:thymidylate kinase
MWSETCGKIFSECVQKLEENDIRYFVLRNYELLPERNSSKDVDIIVEPGKIKKSIKVLLNVYKKNGITHYYETVVGKIHCIHGMNTENKIGIHIDLIEGYLAKGYEIFTFDELYSHTRWYKNFCVMDEFFEGIMLLIYKQFGYKKPKLKQEYKKRIKETVEKYPKEYEEQIAKVTSKELAHKLIEYIKEDNFEEVIDNSKDFTKQLRKYSFTKKPIATMARMLSFFCQKMWRIVFAYRKYARTVAVLAPDGTGKTTFIDALVDELNYYYVNDAEDERMHIYHFRPTVLPNLGEVGEKAGVMEQDKDWTNPHRGKAANPVSSIIRIAYYSMDYIIGFMKCVRRDVHYDKHVLFDRYSYDFIVDPLRTKLGLPKWVRKFFVRLTPQPKIVFVLDASPEVIFERKQELTKEEITRQLRVYRELAGSHKRFHTIDAECTPKEMADEAVKIFLNQYTRKLG